MGGRCVFAKTQHPRGRNTLQTASRAAVLDKSIHPCTGHPITLGHLSEITLGYLRVRVNVRVNVRVLVGVSIASPQTTTIMECSPY